jgi:hypothetical protein
VLRYPRPHSREGPQIIDWGKYDALYGELLNAVEDRFRLGPVALPCLLFEELI